MAEQATAEQVNKFVALTDEFLANYIKLTSPAFRAKIYATGDAAAIANYETQVNRSTALKNSIEAVTGSWNWFKSQWSSVTDTTSMVIGDAIDWFRGIFGGGPNADLRAYSVSPISGGQLGRYDVSPISGGQLGALAAIPVLYAAWIAGTLAALVILIRAQNKIFVWIDAWAIKKNNPNISTAEALDKAAIINARGGIFEGAALPLIAAAAIVAYLIFGKK